MTAQSSFDLIGDVHGCADELEALLQKLGYKRVENRSGQGLYCGPLYQHPEKRQVVFLGDLVDRGPKILETLRLVASMTEAGSALCLLGNHDDKLMRYLKGNAVKIQHGLETTIEALESLPGRERRLFQHDLQLFLQSLPFQLNLDGKKLIAAHAGLKKSLHGRVDAKARSFALYGETTGARDEYGLPIRGDWENRYQGAAMVVFGHTPVEESRWVNNTINIDTGCVFGGALTALRYPERELVSVPAERIYYDSTKPFPPAERHRLKA